MLTFETVNELTLKVTCTGSDVLFTKAGAFIAGENAGGKNYKFEKVLLGPQNNIGQALLGLHEKQDAVAAVIDDEQRDGCHEDVHDARGNNLGACRQAVGQHGDGNVATGAVGGGGSDEREDDHADECGGFGP